MDDAETVEEAFATVEEQNRVVEGEPVGVQLLNGEVTVFVDDGGDDALLLQMEEDDAEKLLHYLEASVGSDGQ